MIREAIILAGGLGTRLSQTVPDVPKCMAPVAGQPFLTYVIRHLLANGIRRFIFSIGYRHEVIEDFLKNHFSYLEYTCVIESKPLGTGGAIRLALPHTHDRDVLIINGDTMFKIDIDDISDKHIEMQADCTLALKLMKNVDRYGTVETENDGRIIRFREKKPVKEGLINGGVYVLNAFHFMRLRMPEVFSFEKDYLEAYVKNLPFTGIQQDGYFIDIGIPEDYKRAQEELRYPVIDIQNIDNTWTLFLDRDGVINYNKDDSYVFHTGEFKFIPGAIEAIRRLSTVFGRIIIVTNQRGVGRGLMEEKALHEIHDHMISKIEEGGGRIDALYYCTQADDKHPDRKPNPGMLLEAAHMYPGIIFSKSIMAGDKMSDMQFGRNAGTQTLMISSSQSSIAEGHPDMDMRVDSLLQFAELFD